MPTSDSADTVEMPIPVEPSLPELPAPEGVLVEVDVAGCTNTGNVRRNNEDQFLIARFGRFLETVSTSLDPRAVPSRAQEIGYGLAVADGIGGSAAGEVASALAISYLTYLILATPDWIQRPEDDAYANEALRRARRRFGQINEAMTKESKADPSLRGFGTTLTVAWNLGDELFLAHAGDSRGYVYHHNALHRLTRDHTLAVALAEQGLIERQDVATNRFRHVLTNVIGGDTKDVQTDVHRLRLFNGDCLLLCTDGLTEMVNDDTIAKILARGDNAEATCKRLIEQALANGGKDNVTVIVARYRMPS